VLPVMLDASISTSYTWRRETRNRREGRVHGDMGQQRAEDGVSSVPYEDMECPPQIQPLRVNWITM
jgi:hypothetical protein